MEKAKSILKSNGFILSVLLLLVAGLLYLPFVFKFGYYYDDWYLMYAAGAKGPMVFREIFSIDRPLRALVMIPAYYFFGSNPIYYNLSAFLFRLLSGLFFLWTLHMVWPRQHWMTLSASLLFLTYPGFLSQPNAIDYQSHLAALATGMLSIALTVKAIQSEHPKDKTILYLFSILLGWFYLSQIEWYIGLEFFRFACIFILAYREQESPWARMLRFLRWAYPSILVPGMFLIWRIFFFESERGATNLELQFGDTLSAPLTSILNWALTLGNDTLDVLFSAWFIPLQRIGFRIASDEWIMGWGIAALVLAVFWGALSLNQKFEDKQPDHRRRLERVEGSRWKREMFWLGFGLILFGLLPVILVGRSVDFKSFSRYTMIASAGASILWTVGLSIIANMRLRTVLVSLLLLSASLTHYANGLAHAHDTESVRNFWWQVSWRIPQMEPGTTLVAHYPVTAEEDYFIWGPANLIYHPESAHQDYVQPAIYAALLNEKTIASVQAKEPQDFSNRRGIRTYKNYRNILILSQPTPASCIHVIDRKQVELSAAEDSRVEAIAPYSETEHIILSEAPHIPPMIPFGAEPAHGWCYLYQKAELARQQGDWESVAALGAEAASLDLIPADPIEWTPFLQAYAYLGQTEKVESLAAKFKDDPFHKGQFCQSLSQMEENGYPLKEEMQNKFCSP